LRQLDYAAVRYAGRWHPIKNTMLNGGALSVGQRRSDGPSVLLRDIAYLGNVVDGHSRLPASPQSNTSNAPRHSLAAQGCRWRSSTGCPIASGGRCAAFCRPADPLEPKRGVLFEPSTRTLGMRSASESKTSLQARTSGASHCTGGLPPVSLSWSFRKATSSCSCPIDVSSSSRGVIVIVRSEPVAEPWCWKLHARIAARRLRVHR
jgi:hypothetical protein